MNAKYYYDMMMNYKQESTEKGLHWFGLANGSVQIHHKYDDDNWYTLFKDGNVILNNRHKLTLDTFGIDDLAGDDFELFFAVQIFKSGYFKLKDTSSVYDVRIELTRLYNYISELEDDHDLDKNSKPGMCGSAMWIRGLLDSGFSFYATNKVEVQINTIHEMIEGNKGRKHYGLRCVPFDKSMKRNNAFHISFVKSICGKENKEIYDDCEKALSDLLLYISRARIRGMWFDTNLKKPVYV